MSPQGQHMNGRILAGSLMLVFAAQAFAASHHEAKPTWTEEQKARYVLDRLGYGPSPGDLDHIKAIGVNAWISEQLHPESLEAPVALTERLAKMDSLKAGAASLYASFGPPARKAANGDEEAIKRVQKNLNDVADQARQARLLAALYSPAQLQESLVDFWFNHFNVFIDKGDEGRLWTGIYERDAIRPYVLGRFRDLLGATAKHPAMLYYLDNVQSAAATVDKNGKPHGGLNENYAREVMELHTLGVDGGYTQHDVTELARILTGWTYDGKRLASGEEDAAFVFDPKKHDVEEKTFLGETFPAGGDIAEGEHALDLLARSPATAQHLAFQLAQYFVADAPPPKLVERLSQRYLKTDGDLRAVMTTLFASPEFWNPANVGMKFKTPLQYVASTVRASGLPMISNIKPLLDALYQNGEPLYACGTPDGYKNTQAAWLNPDAMIFRLNYANALGSGYLPLWQSATPDLIAVAAPPIAASDAAMGMTMMATTPQPALPPSKPKPLDPALIENTLGNALSLNTTEALDSAPANLRAGMILGSPEFMRR